MKTNMDSRSVDVISKDLDSNAISMTITIQKEDDYEREEEHIQDKLDQEEDSQSSHKLNNL